MFKICVVLYLYSYLLFETIADDHLQSLDNVDHSTDMNTKSISLLSNLRKQIQEKENELENAEKINRNFERMIQLVNIMGQVDTFLTDRTKLMLKKLSLLADSLDGTSSPGGGSTSGGHHIKF